MLAVDIETYSDISLTENGVYKYVDSDNFMILLFAYAFDDEDVAIVDLANGEKLPERVTSALLNKDIVKTAFNAQFERVCINKFFNINTENWDCTMVKALSLGLPGSLESVGKVIGIEPDQQKLMTGKNLIRIFSVPHKIKKRQTDEFF
jgi:DNA polymerase